MLQDGCHPMFNLAEQRQVSAPSNPFASSVSRFGRALADLHQRRVFRTAVAYTLAMWLVLQVADVVFDLLDLPRSALKVVAGAAVLGFPVAVGVGWLYQITPNGNLFDRPSRRAALARTRSDWIVNSSLLGLSSAFAFLMLLGVMFPEDREPPRIAIKVTEIAQDSDRATSIAPGLEQELRHQLAQTTNLEPISSEHPSDVRDIVSLVLWVSVRVEDGEVQVRSLLQSLEGESSYPYVGAFDLPIGPRSDLERQAAQRIAAELRGFLFGAGRQMALSEKTGNRATGGTLPGCRSPGLGPINW